MSNLDAYRGNFIDYLDAEFSGRTPQGGREYSGFSGLRLSLSCPVAILPSGSDRGYVFIDSGKPEDFDVQVKSGWLSVSQKQQSGGSVTFSNFGNSVNVTSVSGNMTMVNGRVFVNGQEVKPGSQAAEAEVPSRVIVHMPQRMQLSARLNGSSVLASKVTFAEAEVTVSGQSTVGIAAQDIDFTLSGQGDSYLVCQGGALEVNVSGQGTVTAKAGPSFKKVKAKISGMGSVKTSGLCAGNYDAKVSGMGSISHNGNVNGFIDKKVSGMGSIHGL
jgi:hypothetical protein